MAKVSHHALRRYPVGQIDQQPHNTSNYTNQTTKNSGGSNNRHQQQPLHQIVPSTYFAVPSTQAPGQRVSFEGICFLLLNLF